MKDNYEDPFVVKYVEFSIAKLVDENNQFLPRVSIGEAKKKAFEAGLDLVCFNRPTQDDLAFCKIINFGKWKYENEKKKRKQHSDGKRITKEVRFSAVISDHDIGHKVKQANEFLDDGDEVVLSMKLKGRQKAYFPQAEEKMNGIVAKCLEHGNVVNTKKTHDTITVRLNKKIKIGIG